MPQPTSQFVWYELMTTDAQAAEAFYCQVIGWSAADAGMPGTAYTLLSAGPAVIAGLMALPKEACDAGARPGWIGYVAVDDVDAAARQLQEAGGKVDRPAEDIPGVGRFAVVADLDGASFCLFKGNSAEQPPQPPAGTPGTMGWHELYAGDQDRAWAFYSSQFGWTKDQAIDMGAMGVYQLFAAGGEAIGGMMTKPPEVPQASWLYYVNVAAIDAAVGRVTAAAGHVVSGPMEVPGGMWVAQCMDPQGAMFAMVAPTR
jgi:hypothetical protein